MVIVLFLFFYRCVMSVWIWLSSIMDDVMFSLMRNMCNGIMLVVIIVIRVMV